MRSWIRGVVRGCRCNASKAEEDFYEKKVAEGALFGDDECAGT